MANPRNWRIHPKEQKAALEAVLDEVGWVQDIIKNTRTGNLIDGHLRVNSAIARKEKQVPVTYVDLSPEEETLVLATFDPLALLATPDRILFAELLGEIHTESDALTAFLVSTGESFGVEAPNDDDSLVEGSIFASAPKGFVISVEVPDAAARDRVLSLLTTSGFKAVSKLSRADAAQ